MVLMNTISRSTTKKISGSGLLTVDELSRFLIDLPDDANITITTQSLDRGYGTEWTLSVTTTGT